VNAVTDLLARFTLALDDHDWDGVTRCLAGTVRRDYRSLTGAEPDDIAGPDLVAEWRGALRGLDSHQHLLGPPVVDIDGDVRARAAVSSLARTSWPATRAAPGWSAVPTGSAFTASPATGGSPP
jgi:hypothetical protein